MHRYVRTEFRTVEEVVEALVGLEAHFIAQRDRRGVFATGYLEITRAIQRHMEGGGFEDREWTTRYTVRFANLYRVALLDYEDRAPSRVPKAWRIAFDAARADVGLVIQHLILGVNAHINHDLAVALCDVGIDPERDRRYADHARVNQVLEGATAAMKHRVAALYAPVLHRLDRMAGRIDDDVTNFSIPKAREHAWAFAIALTGARSDAERAVLRACARRSGRRARAARPRLADAAPGVPQLRPVRRAAGLAGAEGAADLLSARTTLIHHGAGRRQRPAKTAAGARPRGRAPAPFRSTGPDCRISRGCP
jgi:hypothetical protein